MAGVVKAMGKSVGEDGKNAAAGRAADKDRCFLA